MYISTMKRKNIDLPQSVIDTLSIQAINSGKKNFKNYVEFLLNQIAEAGGQIIITKKE